MKSIMTFLDYLKKSLRSKIEKFQVYSTKKSRSLLIKMKSKVKIKIKERMKNGSQILMSNNKTMGKLLNKKRRTR